MRIELHLSGYVLLAYDRYFNRLDPEAMPIVNAYDLFYEFFSYTWYSFVVAGFVDYTMPSNKWIILAHSVRLLFWTTIPDDS